MTATVLNTHNWVGLREYTTLKINKTGRITGQGCSFCLYGYVGVSFNRKYYSRNTSGTLIGLQTQNFLLIFVPYYVPLSPTTLHSLYRFNDIKLAESCGPSSQVLSFGHELTPRRDYWADITRGVSNFISITSTSALYLEFY